MKYSQYIYRLFELYHNSMKNNDVLKLYEFVQQTQYWSRNDLEAFQLEKLKALIAHSIASVPYYKKLFKEEKLSINDFSTIDDINKIPFLSKKDIKKNIKNNISQSVPQARIKKNSTSGSSGISFSFYSDKDADIIKTAINLRNHDWMGIDFFSKKLWIWGSHFDVKKQKKIIEYLKNKLIRKKMISSYYLSGKDIMNIINEVNKFEPEFIGAYPSHMQYISTFGDAYSLKHHPKVIQLSGEKLYPNQRKDIQNYFKSNIFDYYGARDGSMIAHECEEHCGLHVLSENVIVEIIDENRKSIKDGKGEVVITDLHNYVMPLIRYKIGDIAEITNKECGCGKKLPLLKKIVGRQFEIIHFPNGNSVGGTFWTILMKRWSGIKKFKVIQEEIDYIKIHYTKDSIFSEKILENIEKEIIKYSGEDLKTEFICVKNIDNSTNGKLQFIKSKIK